MKSGLYIIATPIGNIRDMSERAIECLKEANVIACEDTRISKKLLSLLGVSLKKDFITLHDHNESQHADKLIELINTEDKSVALISDAGSPLISDPGYKLIRVCKEAGVYVTTIPGCCALICALQLSGLPTNRFMFAGFIPNKDKARKEAFLSVKNIQATIVFYETANRIVKTLEAMQEIFTNREIAVVREITKLYEESINGTSQELIKEFAEHPRKGEMVIVIAPPAEEELEKSTTDIETELRAKLTTQSLKDAVKEVAEKYNLNKKSVYETALRIKDEE